MYVCRSPLGTEPDGPRESKLEEKRRRYSAAYLLFTVSRLPRTFLTLSLIPKVDLLKQVMLGVVANHLKDVSVLRRLLFASIQLPEELPNRWGIAVEFATDGKVKRNSIDTSTAAALVENILSFDKRAFDTDDSLMLELIGWVPSTDQRKPLGVVLISPELCCAICRQELTLRKDRPASVVVYDENLGTVPGSHFHKICHNKRCGVTQYYGYYTIGHESSQVFYNAEWRDLRYFVSSSLTVFSMQMLKRIDSQVLIGQLSYKQIAKIFNHVHECYHNPTK